MGDRSHDTDRPYWTTGIYNSFSKEELSQIRIEDYQIKLVIFEPDTAEVLQWIN